MEPPATRKLPGQWPGQGVLTRAALALRLLYGAFVAVGGGQALYPAVPATAVVGRRTYVQAGTPEPWRSHEWRRAVEFHAEVLGRHLADGFLDTSSRAVCLGGAREALALLQAAPSSAAPA